MESSLKTGFLESEEEGTAVEALSCKHELAETADQLRINSELKVVRNIGRFLKTKPIFSQRWMILEPLDCSYSIMLDFWFLSFFSFHLSFWFLPSFLTPFHPSFFSPHSLCVSFPHAS